MNKNSNVNDCLSLMDGFLEDIRHTKQATDPSEPTSHPVMKADDGTQPAKEGERSSENRSDVKKNVGEAGVTGQEDSESAPNNSEKLNVGTQKMDADAVKGNVQQPKATKDGPAENGRGDASSGHPSNNTFSEKYSSALKRGQSILEKIAGAQPSNPSQAGAKASAASGSVKQAESADSENSGKEKAVTPPTPKKAKDEGQVPAQVSMEEKKAAAEKYQDLAAAGYQAAEALAIEMGLFKSASAEDQELADKAEQIIKSAEEDATNVCQFLRGRADAMRKRANDEIAGDQASGGGGEGGPGEGGEMIPPEALEAGAGGGEMPPGAEGGMPGGEGGAPGEGGGSEEEMLATIAAALEEAGVTPEELAAALEAEGGGGGGGEGGGELGGGGEMGGGEMGGGAPAQAEMPPAMAGA